MASNLRITSAGKSEVLLYSTDRQMTGLFVQATVIDSNGDITTTANLTENGNVAGEYQGTITINIEGVYDVLYIPYTDSGHITESERAPRASEIWNVRLTADQFAGARSGATGLVDDDINLFVKEMKKLLGNKPKEDTRAMIEEVFEEKFKTINFKPKITVPTPKVTVKAPNITVKPPVVKIAAPIVHPTPVTVKAPDVIVKPTPVTVNPTPVTVNAPEVKVEAPIVNPTPVTVPTPKVTVNAPVVNINLDEIKDRQDKQEDLLKKISDDIANIKEKEGIVGTSQSLIKQLMS